MQTDTRGEVSAVQIDAEIFRERKLHPGEDTAADTAVLHPCLLAAEVFVVHTTIHEDAEELDGRVAGVEEEAGAVGTADVTVGRFRYALVVHPGILFNRIIVEAVVRAQVHVELLVEKTIVEMDVMALFRVQIRITIRDVQRVGIVHIGIQEADTRAADTHVVAEADLLRLGNLIGERTVGNDVKITRVEVHLRSQRVFHVQCCTLATHTGLDAELAKLHRIAGVDRIDVLVMAEVAVPDKWVGKSLSELKVRELYQINVVGIIRNEEVDVTFDPQEPIPEGAILILIGANSILEKFMHGSRRL